MCATLLDLGIFISDCECSCLCFVLWRWKQEPRKWPYLGQHQSSSAKRTSTVQWRRVSNALKRLPRQLRHKAYLLEGKRTIFLVIIAIFLVIIAIFLVRVLVLDFNLQRRCLEDVRPGMLILGSWYDAYYFPMCLSDCLQAFMGEF